MSIPSVCVVCGEPIDGDELVVGMVQQRGEIHRSVPTHRQCYHDWEAHDSGNPRFTSDQEAAIEARMAQHPWQPVTVRRT